VTWTYFLGWQFIALGLLIIITIVYFQQGIAGWLIEKFPQAFGNKAQREAKKAAPEPSGKLAPQPEGAE
jgi:branched-chain amino acid transport system permease protein